MLFSVLNVLSSVSAAALADKRPAMIEGIPADLRVMLLPFFVINEKAPLFI